MNTPDTACSHAACLEGMAAGPAIEDRWGRPGRELAEEGPGLGPGGRLTWPRRCALYTYVVATAENRYRRRV